MKKAFLLPLLCLLASCESFSDTAYRHPQPGAWSEEGIASWYGDEFHGRKTSNGEVFDQMQLTAAHRTLPFGSLVKVTNTENGKSVVVRINDRGPFVGDRILDLSRAAAEAVDMIGPGTARVALTLEKAGDEGLLYTVQLAAFSSRGNAVAALGSLDGKGVRALLIEGTDGIYRIVIRNVPEEKLDAVKTALREAGYADVLVKKE